MFDLAQTATALLTATLLVAGGCAQKKETLLKAGSDSEQSAGAYSAGQAPLSVQDDPAQDLAMKSPRGAYAELAVRRGGLPDEEGKLQGGEYVPVDFMQLPADHQIGNRLFKYEGPGWESEQVAYRLYFDERAAIDIFGKTKPQLVLPQVGQDGTDYHTLSDWGMDVLKVGPSLGLGGLGIWHQEGLHGVHEFESASLDVFNETEASGIHVKYTGWQSAAGARDLELTLRIEPGSRLTEVVANSASTAPSWATGIVRHGLEPMVSRSEGQEWGYLATWGEQSLANDNLGMAIFYRNADLQQVTADEYNHLAILSGGNQARYFFAAVWRDAGIENREQFEAYLDQTAALLSRRPAVR